MKKIILLILFVLTLGFSFGQEKFKEGLTKIGSDTYQVWFADPVIIAVNLSKNIQEVPKPEQIHEPLPIHERDVQVDTALAKAIIFNVLKNRLPELKHNKDFITVTYIFFPNGKIMNLDYILPLQTIITPKELAKIDQCLRKDIKVCLTGDEYKVYPAIHYNRQKRIYF